MSLELLQKQTFNLPLLIETIKKHLFLDPEVYQSVQGEKCRY